MAFWSCYSPRCVRGGRMHFEDIPAVVEDLVSLWQPIQHFVRYTGPAHIKVKKDAVSIVLT